MLSVWFGNERRRAHVKGRTRMASHAGCIVLASTKRNTTSTACARARYLRPSQRHARRQARTHRLERKHHLVQRCPGCHHAWRRASPCPYAGFAFHTKSRSFEIWHAQSQKSTVKATKVTTRYVDERSAARSPTSGYGGLSESGGNMDMSADSRTGRGEAAARGGWSSERGEIEKSRQLQAIARFRH